MRFFVALSIHSHGLPHRRGNRPCLTTTPAATRRAHPHLVRGLFAASLVSLYAPALAQEGGTSTQAAPQFNGSYAGTNDTGLSPIDIETIVDQSFAQPGSIFPDLAFPWREGYEAFRERLWEEQGFRYALNYSQLFQYPSATLPNATADNSIGGWAAIDIIWTPVDRGGPNEGSLAFTFAYRGALNDNPANAAFGAPVIGSLWSAYEWGEWDGAVIENLFWDQRINQDFLVRVGNQAPQAIYNFSRFKDARTSFTASPFAFQETIPYPAIGFGVAARWQPAFTSGPYVVGTINDMNADPANGPDWSKVTAEGQFFYGAEFGYRWPTAGGGFSHLHFDLFYADERALNPPELPNEAGWGYRIYGEKQIDDLVAFAGYTYNTARGGGIGATLAERTATAGFAYLNPLDIRGEAAIGFVWSEPFEDTLGNAAPGFTARDQYGYEIYWRMQLTPNMSLTPGVQVIYDPSFNLAEDVIVIPQIKFRISL